MARGDSNKPAHSERIADTASERQKEERAREHAREKPPEGSGEKPSEVSTTSKSEFDERIEEKEGRQASRTPEEMSLHEELSRTREDEDEESERKS